MYKIALLSENGTIKLRGVGSPSLLRYSDLGRVKL